LDEFHEQIKALVLQKQEAISKGYFGKASQIRDELRKLRNQKTDVRDRQGES
jgi:hypothetical protein